MSWSSMYMNVAFFLIPSCIKFIPLSIVYYTDFTTSESDEVTFQGKIKNSFGFGVIKGKRNAITTETTKTTSKTQLLVASMRIDRYYSSVREEISPLSDDALSLLNNEDYVGFFKSCGPNYTRGIRRAQEVVATLEFESSSQTKAELFVSTMKRKKWFDKSSKITISAAVNKQEETSLDISILAFGMGLHQGGSETLIASNFEEYFNAMKFAFTTMTRTEKADQIGMVYGIEFVPWVYNSAWQVASGVSTQVIETPMPRSMIPKAYPSAEADKELVFGNTAEIRSKFRCKNTEFKVDKYGYCCEAEQLYDTTNEAYRTAATIDEANDVCRPIRILNPVLIKDNMATNAEFVARMEAAFRTKMDMLGVLERCITASRVFPVTKLHNYLQQRPTANGLYDGTLDTLVTLLELQLGIDPKGDYGLLKHLTEELDEWVDMFYSPCYAAIFGKNIGTTPDVDVNYFRAYPWYDHAECTYLTCLQEGYRWDRKDGGCVTGLIRGTSAQVYDKTNVASYAKCSKDINENSQDLEICKYLEASLDDLQKDYNTCWANIEISNVYDLVDNYCNPELDFDLGFLDWDVTITPNDSDTTASKRETLNKAYNSNSCRNLSGSPNALPETKPITRRLSLEEDDDDEALPAIDANASLVDERETAPEPVLEMNEDEDFVNELKRRVARSRK